MTDTQGAMSDVLRVFFFSSKARHSYPTSQTVVNQGFFTN